MKILSCRTHSPIAGTCPSIGAWQQRGCGSTKHPKPDEASTANAAVVLLRRTRRNLCESSTKVQGQHVAVQRKKESWDEDSKQMWIITLEYFRCASASFQLVLFVSHSSLKNSGFSEILSAIHMLGESLCLALF